MECAPCIPARPVELNRKRGGTPRAAAVTSAQRVGGVAVGAPPLSCARVIPYNESLINCTNATALLKSDSKSDFPDADVI
jgi:hypothetical protein